MGRCPWATAGDAIYEAYHDEDWGVPVRDEHGLFAKLCLDGLQAGLSWRVILGKRDALYEIYQDFSPDRLSQWGEPQYARVIEDSRGIRSRRKAEGMVKNARAFLAMKDAGASFHDLVWDSVGGTTRINRWKAMEEVPAQTPESEALSKALKKHGFSYCGPVIVYAFMQAVGVVNDHLVTCPRHADCAAMA
jgi:DNA-3-methyladenine glycosylase I